MDNFNRANSFRIIGSAIYDGLVVMGLLMIAGFLAVLVNKLLTGQEAIASHNLLFQAYLLAVVSGYFVFFWRRHGQTVGMKAWRLWLVSTTEQPVRVSRLMLRLLVAIPAYGCLLIGVFWQYIDKANLNWHDHASQSKLVHVPKQKKQKTK